MPPPAAAGRFSAPRFAWCQGIPGLFSQLPPKRNFICSPPGSSLWMPPPPRPCKASFSCAPQLLVTHHADAESSVSGSVYSAPGSESLAGRGQRLAGGWHPSHSVRVILLDRRVVSPCVSSVLWTALKQAVVLPFQWKREK